MILQITSMYPGCPDVRDMTMYDVDFFYDGLSGTLKKMTNNVSK